MSSIIDALKKSDNNRTKDSGNNINQINFGNETKKPSRRGFWLLVLFLLLAAFGVLAWQQGWHRGLMAYAGNWFQTEQTTGPNKQTADNSKKPAKSTPESAPSNKLTPPKADQVRAKSTATLSAKNKNNKVQSESANVENTNVENTNVKPNKQQGKQAKNNLVPAMDANAETSGSPEQSTEPLDEQLTVVSNNRKKQQAMAAKKQAKTEINQKDRSLEPNLKQDYLLIHQIDFEIRKNIPPIKLNIHIYDPEPENRLVMMNGIKFQVGDVIDEIVTVEEISQEGVVLSFENIKFLVPK